MYLVLLALLALNIQVDFIDAFFDLSTSIEHTVDKLDKEKTQRILSIKEVYKIDSLTYNNSYLKSNKAILLVQNATEYIDGLQELLISKTGGYNEFGYPKNSIDPKIPDFVLLQKSGATHLKNLLFSTKKELLLLLDEEHQYLLDSIYETSDYVINSRGIKLGWEKYHFNNLALGGALAILSGFKKDVKMMESIILNYYQNEIFGKLTSFIAPDIIGDSALIDLGLANSRSYKIGDKIKVRLQIPNRNNLDSAEIVLLDNNNEKIKDIKINKQLNELLYTAKNTGNYKVFAKLFYKNKEENRTISTKFNVVSKNNISYITIDDIIKSKNFNLLFLGVNNKIIIHHPLYSIEQLSVSSNNGEIKKSGEVYHLMPSRTGFSVVSVYHKNKKLAERKFLIMNLPDPTAVINNSNQSETSLNLFKIQSGIALKTSDTDLQNAYQIKNFKLQRYNINGNRLFEGENTSAFFSGEVLNQVRSAKVGDNYIFSQILVKSNDGRSRYISPLLIDIK